MVNIMVYKTPLYVNKPGVTRSSWYITWQPAQLINKF